MAGDDWFINADDVRQAILKLKPAKTDGMHELYEQNSFPAAKMPTEMAFRCVPAHLHL